MKSPKLLLSLGLPALLLALSAQAHDPKEHMQEAQKPDCEAMKDMDHSKMDVKDPMMQAMMQKCMKDMDHSKMDMKDMDGDKNAEAESAHDGHEQQAEMEQKNEKETSPEHKH